MNSLQIKLKYGLSLETCLEHVKGNIVIVLGSYFRPENGLFGPFFKKTWATFKFSNKNHQLTSFDDNSM